MHSWSVCPANTICSSKVMRINYSFNLAFGYFLIWTDNTRVTSTHDAFGQLSEEIPLDISCSNGTRCILCLFETTISQQENTTNFIKHTVCLCRDLKSPHFECETWTWFSPFNRNTIRLFISCPYQLNKMSKFYADQFWILQTFYRLKFSYSSCMCW